MNVLLIGSGGREHALAWALSKSPKLTKLYVAPGNAGTASIAETVDMDVSDQEKVLNFCREHKIELVVVGPEVPLVQGIADRLTAEGIKTFGPGADAARLEGSKGFTKDLCADAGIPTAKYAKFRNAEEAKNYIRRNNLPIVVKADGLAAGKGVVVAATEADALDAVDNCFSGAFGVEGEEVVIEECLLGEEVSFFVLSDGKNFLPLLSAQDHKRVWDGDEGPNTGGMGAYCPAPIMSELMTGRTIEEIIKPTIDAMKNRGCPFKGVLYAGLMITESGPKLIEYNVRFGDPECQALMLSLKSDLLELLLATVNGNLENTKVDWHPGATMTVVMAANGYPGNYNKGTPITGLEKAQEYPDVVVFHAGTKVEDNKLVANGGRVLNITARGETIEHAQRRAYTAIEKINWDDGFFRKDIGWRAIQDPERT